MEQRSPSARSVSPSRFLTTPGCCSGTLPLCSGTHHFSLSAISGFLFVIAPTSISPRDIGTVLHIFMEVCIFIAKQELQAASQNRIAQIFHFERHRFSEKYNESAFIRPFYRTVHLIYFYHSKGAIAKENVRFELFSAASNNAIQQNTPTKYRRIHYEPQM